MGAVAGVAGRAPRRFGDLEDARVLEMARTRPRVSPHTMRLPSAGNGRIAHWAGKCNDPPDDPHLRPCPALSRVPTPSRPWSRTTARRPTGSRAAALRDLHHSSPRSRRGGADDLDSQLLANHAYAQRLDDSENVDAYAQMDAWALANAGSTSPSAGSRACPRGSSTRARARAQARPERNQLEEIDAVVGMTSLYELRAGQDASPASRSGLPTRSRSCAATTRRRQPHRRGPARHRQPQEAHVRRARARA